MQSDSRDAAQARRRAGPLDRARVLAFAALPHHALSRMALGVTRVRSRAAQPVIRWFIRRFGVDMSEAADPSPSAYASFNAFFTRALRPGVRPVEGTAATLVSPVDGRVSQAGTVDRDRLIQAKGIDYSLAALLGGDPALARALDGGVFATLYLAPGDYHRIHMPLTGRLQRMTYVPGRLYSVAPWTVRALDGLFTRNERVCAVYRTAVGPMALAFVGALNVGAIETRWAGAVTPPRGPSIASWHYPAERIRYARGDEVARFNMGSTVVVIAPPGSRLHPGITPGSRVRVGQALGEVEAAAERGAGRGSA